MSEFLHKKIRIEDNGLTSKGRIIADHKIADGITGKKNETEESLGGGLIFTWISHVLSATQLFTLSVG